MSNFDEILNQGKKKEADVQTAESTDKKDKKEWADEQKRKRDSLFEMIDAVCPTIVSSTEEMSEFLTVQSRFEKYSLNNMRQRSRILKDGRRKAVPSKKGARAL